MKLNLIYLLIAFITSTISAQTELIRGPYLQIGTPNSVIVRWRTNTPTTSTVNFGTSLGALNNTISDNALKTDHQVLIDSLTENTTYYYEISDMNGVYVTENIDQYIKTSPLVGDKQFVRAWILGDAGTGTLNQINVREEYYDYVNNTTTHPNQTDMMLFLGDNAYDDGTDSEYQSGMFDVYNDQLKKSVAWSTLGNHEGHTANSNTQSGPYYDIFSLPTAGESGGVPSGTEAYYSFDYANIHFIVLESHQLYNDRTQMDWCTADIQATSQDWIVALFHHPPYSKGSHNSDFEPELIAMRKNFLPILEGNGVDLVLSGHSHSYERSFFLNSHYGKSYTFNGNKHTVGYNGCLSGKSDTEDSAYLKRETDTKGAVYITTGSAGKISGGSLNHRAMYASLNQLGSCVLEVDSDGNIGQNLTVKFINDNGNISDYFTINKTNAEVDGSDVNNPSDLKIYPIPVDTFLNIDLRGNDSIYTIRFFNVIGELIKEETNQVIDVSNLSSGTYFLEIISRKEKYYKKIIVK